MAEAALAEPWAAEGAGVAVWLRLTPKGGRDALEGVETLADGRAVLKARVRVAAEGGKANAAVTRLVAQALGAAPSAVSVVSGHKARVKKLFVAGDPAPILAALAKRQAA